VAKVFLDGYLEVPPEQVDTVAAALPEHIHLTRTEPGCLRFEVLQDPEQPTHFVVSEVFADRAAFEAHQHRAASSPWAKVTAGMPRHYTIRDEA
jgi:quinol monooxygenase YgiN